MSERVNSHNSSEARRSLGIFSIKKQGCGDAKRWRDFPKGAQLFRASDGTPPSPYDSLGRFGRPPAKAASFIASKACTFVVSGCVG